MKVIVTPMWKLQLAVYLMVLQAQIGICVASAPDDPTATTPVGNGSVPIEMRWEARWRRPADCGCSAAYVMLDLLGAGASFDRVASAIPIDPNVGCSMQSLHHGMESLGVATSIRFITPEELSGVPRPFILHTADGLRNGAGHFTVVAAFNSSNRQYGIIDTSDESFKWIPEASLEGQLSGYVLVTDVDINSKWRLWAGCLSLAVGVIVAIIALKSWRVRRIN